MSGKISPLLDLLPHIFLPTDLEPELITSFRQKNARQNMSSLFIFHHTFFAALRSPMTMPIECTTETIRPSQVEFGEIAYEVMNHVYHIHNEFGRFFDEAVYKRELASRMQGLELELPVTVTYGSFRKVYRLDVLAYKQGIFEFKAAESIVARHRSQTIN
jgi:GxxExxY protein